jgi:hypothetical protein
MAFFPESRLYNARARPLFRAMQLQAYRNITSAIIRGISMRSVLLWLIGIPIPIIIILWLITGHA